MPALRERPGDIGLLVAHFIERDGVSAGVSGCTEAAWQVLLAYHYPGNVRQLEHAVQRAIAVARGPEIDVDDLPDELRAPAAPPAALDGTVAGARERAEREMIVATLTRNGGEIMAAARELNVSRTTLWRLMKKHGLGDP
jgi:DNA-binding NtrC family response regulator